MSKLRKELTFSSLNFDKTQMESNIIAILYFKLKFIFGAAIFVMLMDIQQQQDENGTFIKQIIQGVDELIQNQNNYFVLILSVGFLIQAISYVLEFGVKKITIFKLTIIYRLLCQAIQYGIIFVMMKVILNDGSGWILCILSVLLIGSNIVRELIISLVWISYSVSSKNKFSHRLSFRLFMLTIAQQLLFIIRCYVFFTQESQLSQILSNVIDCLFLSMILLRGVNNLISTKYYLDELSDSLQLYSSLCSFFILLLRKITIAIVENVDVEITSPQIIAIVVSLFAIVSIRAYKQHKQSSIFYQQYQHITRQRDILLFIEAFFHLYKNKQSTTNQLQVIGLYKQHIYDCRDVKCYCHHIINQQQHQSKHIYHQFLQYYLKHVTNKFLTLTLSTDTKLIVLNFLLQLFRDFLHVSKNINTIQTNNYYYQNSLFVHIGIEQLKYKLDKLYNLKKSIHQIQRFQHPILLNQTLTQIQQIIINDLYIKSRKWRYLCGALIKSLQIQQDIVKQIQYISRFQKIFNQNKQRFRKSVAFNFLCLFYYAQVVFLNKQLKPIQQNIKDIKLSINKNSIIGYKDILSNIFDCRCTILSFNLSQSEISEQTNLLITNCDRNVSVIFKIERQKMIGKRLSTIYPQFLWQDNQQKIISYITSNNHKSGEQQKRQYQQCYSNYFVDKNSHVFQGLQWMKMINKNDGIYLLIAVFQKQTDNLLLVNQNKIIQNAGQTYIKYFGPQSDSIPLEGLFYSQQQYQTFVNHFDQIDQQHRNNQYTHSLIFGTQIGQQWKKYLQNLKSYLNKKTNLQSKLINTQKHNNSKMKSTKSIKHLNQKVSNYISQQKNKLMIIKKRSSQSSYQTNNQVIEEENHKKSILIVTFSCLKINFFQKKQFFVIQLKQFKRNKPQRRRKKTFYNLPQYHQKIPSLQALYSQNYVASNTSNNHLRPQKQIDQIKQDNNDFNDNEKLSIDKVQQYGHEFQSIDFHQHQDIQQKEKLKFLNENQSVQSSIKGQSLSFFYRNFIQICFNLFKNPSQIMDARLKSFTVISFILCLMLCIVVILAYFLFDLGLYEVRDIFFADGAVSDNMQLSQFMYNRAMNFKQYQNSSIKLYHASMSSFYEREYLMGLVDFDVQQFLLSVTKMTSTKFYQYLMIPVQWDTINSDTQYIQSAHFITFYYYLVKQVQTIAMNNNTTNQTQLINNALNLMKQNFPYLKQINHYNLDLYRQMSDNSLNLIENVVYILGSCHLFLTLLGFYIFYRQKMFRRRQQMQGYTIYKLIPNKIIEILSKYYIEKSLSLTQRHDLKKYQTQFEIEGIYLPIDVTEFSKPNNSGFIANNFKSPMAIWKIFFIIFSLNILFFIILFKVHELSVPIRTMMQDVNDLMDSQNYLLEAYFDLKAKFIIDESQYIDDQFLDQLMESQQSSDVIFDRISVESLNLFSNYDDTYKGEFIDLLINDTCKLTQSVLSDYQNNKCKYFFSNSILQNGVIMGMNFFTRKVRETIMMLKQQVRDEGQNGSVKVDLQSMKALFASRDFREIDESIIFMFKLYQATQARIYQSLQTTIINLLNISLVLILMQVMILGLFYPIFLLNNYRSQKVQLSKMYMSFLLIPTPISKMIKSFAIKIQDILEYDRNNG